MPAGRRAFLQGLGLSALAGPHIILPRAYVANVEDIITEQPEIQLPEKPQIIIASQLPDVLTICKLLVTSFSVSHEVADITHFGADYSCVNPTTMHLQLDAVNDGPVVWSAEAQEGISKRTHRYTAYLVAEKVEK